MAVGIQDVPPLANPVASDPQPGSIPAITRAEPGEDRTYRFRLAQVGRMMATGVLPDASPLELLDGVLVGKTTRDDLHLGTTHLLADAVRDLPPQGGLVLKQDPTVLPDGPTGHPSLPEPDVTLLRGSMRDYLVRKPLPEYVGLVIEVSDTTLSEDRKKITRSARCNIPSAWIVHLAKRTVEVCTKASGPGGRSALPLDAHLQRVGVDPGRDRRGRGRPDRGGEHLALS